MRRWIARELGFKDKSLVGYWPLVENFLDHSGGGSHLIPVSTAMPLIKTQGRVGISTVAATAKANAAASNQLDLNALLSSADANRRQFSVSFWTLIPDTVIGGHLLGQTEDAGGFGWKGWCFDWSLYFYGLRFGIAESSINSGTSYYTVAPYFFPRGRWVHIAATARLDTVTGYNTRLYINGLPAHYSYGSGGLTTAPTTSSLPLTVGTDNAGAPFGPNPIDAQFGMIRAYNRALRPKEIGAIYERERDAYSWKPTLLKQVTQNGAPTLFMSGYDVNVNNRTLFVEGGPTNNRTTLLTWGHAPFNEDTTLVTSGHIQVTTGSTLAVTGGPNFIEGKLFIEGGPTTTGLNLFIEGHKSTIVAGSPLSILGATSQYGVAGSANFVIEGEAADVVGGMNLYIHGPDTISVVKNMNLYIKGEYAQTVAGIPFLVKGEIVACPQLWEEWDELWEDAEPFWDCAPNTWPQSAGAMTLFLKGQSIGEYERGMNLYVRTPEGAGTTLFVQGPAGTQTSGQTLFVSGAYPVTQGMNLVIPNTTAAFLHGAMLYTHGF